LFAAYERVDFIGLNLFGFDVAHSGVQQGGALASNRFQHRQNGVAVTIHKASGCPDANAFTKQRDNLCGFLLVNPHVVQRLLLAECPVASPATIALHDAIMIFKTPVFLGFSMTAITLHLRLSRPSLTVILYLLDTTEGFGLWLRRASVTSTDAAFILLFVHFARPAFRPSAFFCIFTGCLRFGFRSGFATLAAYLRKIPANLLVYFHNGHNIPKPLGYYKENLQLFSRKESRCVLRPEVAH
jgi:hypothetical protein